MDDDICPAVPDLQTLIAPLTERQFLDLLRERKLTFLPGSDPRRFETLLSWKALNQLLDSETFPLQRLRVVRESTHIPTSLYIKHGQLVSAALSKLLDKGVSLIFNQLERHIPALRALCNDITRRTSEQTSVAAVVTSGQGGALKCHYDDEDLIIIQVAGTKRWQVFGPSIVTGRPPQGPPVFDRVLQPGDVLCLPSEQWHHCENGPHRSLHVTILFFPPTGRHLMPRLVSQLLSEEVFRRPLTRLSDPEILAAHEAALKARLVDAIETMSVTTFLKDRAASCQSDGVHLEGNADQCDDVAMTGTRK
jgi:ribosomal protein L16 Arg81 hydroxylase